MTLLIAIDKKICKVEFINAISNVISSVIISNVIKDNVINSNAIISNVIISNATYIKCNKYCHYK